MSVKILKTKRRFVNVVYLFLKRLPPKDYTTTGEIEIVMNDIIPSFKPLVKEYTQFGEQADEISKRFDNKEINEDGFKKGMGEINREFRNYNDVHGNEKVEIQLDREAFNSLMNMFNRDTMGKNWFSSIEDYMEFREDINTTNRQAKDGQGEDEK